MSLAKSTMASIPTGMFRGTSGGRAVQEEIQQRRAINRICGGDAPEPTARNSLELKQKVFHQLMVRNSSRNDPRENTSSSDKTASRSSPAKKGSVAPVSSLPGGSLASSLPGGFPASPAPSPGPAAHLRRSASRLPTRKVCCIDHRQPNSWNPGLRPKPNLHQRSLSANPLVQVSQRDETVDSYCKSSNSDPSNRSTASLVSNNP